MAKLYTKAMITLEVYSFILMNMIDCTSNKRLNWSPFGEDTNTYFYGEPM
jgi:hypothetical protein